MTGKRIFKFVPAALLVVFLIGCEVSFFVAFNEGTSKLFVRVTDAKPALPHGVEAVLITFEEFFVHKEGGKWYSLPLLQTPYSVDLLKFQTGRTTTLVQPASLASGIYDRIRVLIGGAAVLRDDRFYAVAIPSGKLVIEKGYSFNLEDGRTMDLTVDFDLSQSLATTGSQSDCSYELNPVLHINHTEEAATIRGEIGPETFVEHGTTEAMVTVIIDKDFSGGLSTGDEEYTRIVVVEGDPAFSIFWLVPEQGYTVQIEMDASGPPVFEQFIFPADLQKGDTFELNFGSLI